VTAATLDRVEHRFRGRGTVKAAFSDKSPEILIAGAAGTGKSRGLLEKMYALAVKYPGMKGLMLRKTNVSLAATGLVTWEQHVVAEALLTGGVKYFGGSKRQPPGYIFANGSFVAVGGMDNPMKVMSSEYDVIYVQEANEFTEDEWEKCTTRLRNGRMPYQQLLADCNPQEPTHWLKVRCDRGQTKYYQSTHEENPVYFDEIRTVGPDGVELIEYKVTPAGEEYIAKLDALTGVRYQRLRLGLWVAAEGAIYEQWNPAIHLIQRPEKPPKHVEHVVDQHGIPWNWPRYWAIDFGYRNPMVVQRWAEKPDGELILYAEHYLTSTPVDEMCRLVMDDVSGPPAGWIPDQRGPRWPDGSPKVPARLREWREPKPSNVVADHDAEGRAVWVRDTGLQTTSARKEVLDGIQEVQVRLRDKRMFVMRDSLRHPIDQSLADVKKPCQTVEEFPSYVWDTGAGKLIKEAPLKDNDHGMDAARYIAMARSARSRGGVRGVG
jgi:phage terminase large subunit